MYEIRVAFMNGAYICEVFDKNKKRTGTDLNGREFEKPVFVGTREECGSYIERVMKFAAQSV